MKNMTPEETRPKYRKRNPHRHAAAASKRIKAIVQILTKRAAAAKVWRSEKDHRQMAGHGYVLFYWGEVCGWARELNNADASKWCPDVIAVAVNGVAEPIYMATGGNDRTGATEWSLIWNPALSAEVAESRTEDLLTDFL